MLKKRKNRNIVDIKPQPFYDKNFTYNADYSFWI